MTPVVTFGIPIAPRCRVKNWEKAMDNLNRTLNSLENQTSENYNVVLVRTNKDELRLDKDYRNLFILDNPELDEFSIDKDNKTREAMYLHWSTGGEYFFRLDWDDLVSKDLVEYIEKGGDEYGYMIQYGYFYKPETNECIPFDNYWTQCGSAFGIAFSQEECINGPSHEFHHQRIPANRLKIGKPLSIIPFRAGMYVIHGENISTPKHERIFKEAKWQFITKEIAEEFGL